MDRMTASGFASGWRLPRFEGRLAGVLLPLWIVLLAIALVSSGFALKVVVDRIASAVTAPQAMGFVISNSGPYPTVGTLTNVAHDRGLERGDLILAVDGRPAGDDAINFARQLPARPGQGVRLTVRSSDGRVRTVALIRDEAPFRRELKRSALTPHVVAFGIQGIHFLFGEPLFLVAAIALMAKRSRDPVAPWASLMMVLFVLGSSGASQWLTSQFLHEQGVHPYLNALAYSAVAIVLSVFPDGRLAPRWSIVAAAFGIAAAVGSQRLDSATADLLIMLSQVGCVATIVARYRRMPDGTSRQQVRWALLSIGASVAALLLGSLCQLFDRYVVGIGSDLWLRIGANIFFSLTHALIVLGITVALLRYRLYDADAAIVRSVAYSAMTLGILGVFAVSQKLIQLAEDQYIGGSLGPLKDALGGIIATAMIAPLKTRTTTWAERKFRGDLTHLVADLPRLLDEWRETMAPAELADIVLADIVQKLRAMRGAVLAADGDVLATNGIERSIVGQWSARWTPSADDHKLLFDRDDRDFPVRLPLRTRSARLVGWLLLGPRPDGSLYGKDERAAVETLSESMASALHLAARQHDAQVRQQAWNDRLADEIDVLRRAIASLQLIAGGRKV